MARHAPADRGRMATRQRRARVERGGYRVGRRLLHLLRRRLPGDEGEGGHRLHVRDHRDRRAAALWRRYDDGLRGNELSLRDGAWLHARARPLISSQRTSMPSRIAIAPPKPIAIVMAANRR